MIFGGLKKRQDKGTYIALSSLLLVFLAFSFTPFNLTEVDKTGLSDTLNNDIDKLFRVFWLLFCFFILFLKKPSVLVFFIYRNNVFVLFTIAYFFLLIFSVTVNGLGIVAYYRVLEYLILILGVLLINLIIKDYGKLSAVIFFSNVIWQTAFLILLVIGIGLLVNTDHFYALETQGRVRLGGSAYSPNLLGMVLTMGALASIYLFTKENSSIKRMVLIFATMLFSVGLWYTGSRTAQLAFFASIFFWGFLKLNVSSKIFLFLLLTVLLSISLILFRDEIFSLLLTAIGKGATPLYDILTLNNRSVVFLVGLEGALENWGYGVGFVEGVKEFYRNNFTQSYWLPPHSHNSLMESFLSSGVLSLLFFFVIYCILFTKLIFGVFHKIALEDKYMLVLFVPLMLASITMIVFGGVYSVLTLWFFCGFSLILAKNEK